MKPKPSILFLYILLISNQLSAQVGYQIISGARSRSMGDASLGFQDINAVYHNPAGLIGVKQAGFLLSSEIRFGVKDLHPLSIATVLPTNSGVFSLSFQNFRFDDYRENKIALGYARRFAEKLNIGIELNFLHLDLNEYGSRGLIAFSIGCQSAIASDLVLSAHAYNPVPIKLNELDRSPSVFRLGLAYTLNPKVLICLETEKDIHMPATFKFGLEYKVIPTIALRCGFNTYPAGFSFGFDYLFAKNFTLDLALFQNNALGATPALSLIYNWGKETKAQKSADQ